MALIMSTAHCAGVTKRISVIGTISTPKRVEMMKQGIDPSNELEKEHLRDVISLSLIQ
jgi:hypothetical protein